MVSILGHHDPYEFPEPIELELRLKDVLEDEVDEKFYLDNEKANNFISTVEGVVVGRAEGIPIKNATKKGYIKAYDGDGVDLAYPDSKTRRGRVQKGLSQTLTTDDSKGVVVDNSNIKPINPLKDKTSNGWHFEQQVYDPNGITRTVKAGGGSGNIPKVIEPKAERLGGIFDKDGTKHQAGAVWDKEQLSPTLDTMQGGWRQPSVVVGASRGRNPKNPSDRTVGSPTEQRLEINKQGTSNTITTVQKDNYVLEGIDVHPFSKKLEFRDYKQKEISPCLLATDYKAPKTILESQTNSLRIRKLTPKECWRLMGFSDDDFHKAEEVNSNTQLYKQAGNSIVVDVLEGIFKQLLEVL